MCLYQPSLTVSYLIPSQMLSVTPLPHPLPTSSCLSLSFCQHYLSHLFFLSTCHLRSSPHLSAVFFLLSLLSFILCALISIRLFHLRPYPSQSLHCLPFFFIPLSLSHLLPLCCCHCFTSGAWWYKWVTEHQGLLLLIWTQRGTQLSFLTTTSSP